MRFEQRNGGQQVDTRFPETKWIAAIGIGLVVYLIGEAMGLWR